MSTDEIPRPAAGPPAAESGSTWIADQIVAKIAAAAAREVDGVEDLRGGGIRRGWVRASDRGRGGAAGVRIEDGRASIDLRLVVRDGAAIPAVVERRARPGDRARPARHRPDGHEGQHRRGQRRPGARAEPEPAPEPAAADAPEAEAPAEPS